MKIRLLVIIFIVFYSANINAQTENSITSTEKVYGLSKIWKEVSYNFAFISQVPDIKWDSCYLATIPKVLGTKNDWDYYQELQKFVAILKDGHTRVFPPAELRNKYYGSTIRKLSTKLIENKIIIIKIFDSLLMKQGLKPGMEIISINDNPPIEYAGKMVSPYIYASTPQDRNYQIYSQFLLSGNVLDTVKLGIEKFDGSVQNFLINKEPWTMEQEKFEDSPFEYKLIEKNIAYLKINNFVEGEYVRRDFDSIYTKILLTDALIIDLRDNIGGCTDISHYVLKHFASKPFKSGKWRSPNNIAAYRGWGRPIGWFESEGFEVLPHYNKDIYSKPIVLLIDESTFSCAEDFCVDFTAMNRGRLIGNRTAGSSGTPLIINLPGGGIAFVCTKQDFFQDGKRICGLWNFSNY